MKAAGFKSIREYQKVTCVLSLISLRPNGLLYMIYTVVYHTCVV